MSTHAAQNKIHKNKKTQTKFKIRLDFLFIPLMVIVHDATNLMFMDQCFPTEKDVCFYNVCKPFKTCILYCYRRDMEINAGC